MATAEKESSMVETISDVEKPDGMLSRYSIKLIANEELKNGKIVAFDEVMKTFVNIRQDTVPYSSEINYRKIVRELELCVKLFHKNIINILNLFSPEQSSADFSSFFIVYNFMDYTLSHLIETRDWLQQRNKSTGAERLSFIAFQLFCAVDYLHKAGICHRDLRPETIMVNKKCRLKIAQLGNARHVSEIAELPHEPDSYGYRAPEIFYEIKTQKNNWIKAKKNLDEFKPQMPPNPSSDVWSLGIILYEIVSGEKLFPDLDEKTENPYEQVVKVAKDLPTKINSESFPSTHHGHALLQRLIATAPETRITVKQALNVEYVRWVRMEGDIGVPPPQCITVGLDKVRFSLNDWKDNLFQMIKDYERTKDINKWEPKLPPEDSPAEPTQKKPLGK
uniref:Protein kinase domain-containing protein n=1 Tax=Panagrolaimus sp. ES5 TaxID=591445 RepID=A0AC34FDF0_9BILA